MNISDAMMVKQSPVMILWPPWQSATDKDLTHFAKWYSQSGTPTISVERIYDKQNKTLHVTLSQHTPPTADQSEKVALYIPVAFECVDNEGQHYLDQEGLINDGLVILDKPSLSMTFSHVPESTIPVILGNFSAPVKVDNPLSVAEWIRVFKYASDAFNRWDAIQSLYDWCVRQLEQQSEIPSEVWSSLAEVFEQEKQNHELLAECLSIPSFETLCQNRSGIQVQPLVDARESFVRQFATQMAPVLTTIWQGIQLGGYQYTQQQVNARRCKNVILGLLARTPDGNALIETHFNNADNMTDTLGALKAGQIKADGLFEKLMTQFEQKWRQDPLVLDKWFALHATTHRDDILAHITMLKAHPQFTMGNPNRVRSLIGSFAFYNASGFHKLDGSGYQFVTDYIIELDKQNPQVAARIVTPLTQWQQYHPSHQVLMKKQLNRLLDHKALSKDVFEKVSKSLAYKNRESH